MSRLEDGDQKITELNICTKVCTTPIPEKFGPSQIFWDMLQAAKTNINLNIKASVLLIFISYFYFGCLLENSYFLINTFFGSCIQFQRKFCHVNFSIDNRGRTASLPNERLTNRAVAFTDFLRA